jgi:CRP/FNR family transcriptional regulator, nitrogen oxide reductase regulator
MTTARVLGVRTPLAHVTGGQQNMAERVSFMCASSLFAGLPRQVCWEFASCARARLFLRDELLFMQGQPVCSLFLIQSGSVKLTQLSPGGSEVILWMKGVGDSVGEHPGQLACIHTCTARAMERCQALTWENAYLQNLLAAYTQLRLNVNQILSGRLSELEERFRELATENVARRLALTLLRLSKKVGKDNPSGVQISLSREELAQMTGATLFTISRIISKWSDEGLVKPCREAVIVKDPRRLAQVCGDQN